MSNSEPNSTSLDRLIGHNLKRLRDQSGKSTADLAAAIDVSVPQIYKYMSGTSRLSAGNLMQLTFYLEQSPMEFVAGASSDISPYFVNETNPRYYREQFIQNERIRSKLPKLSSAEREVVETMIDALINKKTVK